MGRVFLQNRAEVSYYEQYVMPIPEAIQAKQLQWGHLNNTQ